MGKHRRVQFRGILVSLLTIVACAGVRAQEDSVQRARQLSAEASALYRQGHYREAIPLARDALTIIQEVRGPEHPSTATALNNLALMYEATGDYVTAAPLLDRALRIDQNTLGPEDPATAIDLSNLGELYYKIGAFAQAESADLSALAIKEKTLGLEHPGTAISINNLGELYRAAGDYKKAQPLLERAVVVREKVLGADDPDTAGSLNNLALLHVATGGYAEAESLYQRALAAKENSLGPEHPATLQTLGNLAALYVTIGARDKAEPLLTRILVATEKVPGSNQTSRGAAMNNLAELYFQAGMYRKAEDLFERALAITSNALGPDHPDTATALNNLAALYRASGEYTKAEPLLERALIIRAKVLGPENPDTAGTLGNLADLYSNTGAYAQAAPLYQRAVEISEKTIGPDSPATAGALNGLATAYYLTGDYAKARPLFERALRIRQKALGAEHPDTAVVLNNLANLHMATGAYGAAEPLYQQALNISETTLGPEHPSTALSLNNLANFYKVTGAYTKAEPLYVRSLAVTKKFLGAEHPNTVVELENLGAVYEAMGTHAKAEPLFERAQAIAERNTSRYMLSGSETRKRAYLQQRFGSVEAYVTLSLAHTTVRSTALGLTSVLQYKGRVLDAMSDSVARLRRSVAPGDQALLNQLSDVARELSTLTFRGPENMSAEVYRRRLDELAEQEGKLQSDLASRSAMFRLATDPITLERVRQAVPADAELVELVRYAPFVPKSNANMLSGPPRYAAYVLKHAGQPVVVDLGDAQAIESLIGEFRTALSDSSTTYVRELSEKLFEKLIQPLSPYLLSGERLLISPDGALNLVPFAALLDRKGEYLNQHFEITYLTSGRDLLSMGVEVPAGGSVVIVANPNYGQRSDVELAASTDVHAQRSSELDRNGLVFGPLPGTAGEVRSLQSLFKPDALSALTGDNATEERLRELHGPRILHVATHGFFLEDQRVLFPQPVELGTEASTPFGENPLLRAGLALAGANLRRSGASDDGILTAAEAAQLDLLGTQLVVLSACETGVGVVTTGEGVYGLRRALVLAGAQTQITSLWKISDIATQELMQDFYRRLLEGAGRSEALRAAQRAIMMKPERRHPYYWAAFVSVGDWTALKAQRTARVH